MLMRVVAVMLLLSAGIAAEAMSYSFVCKASGRFDHTAEDRYQVIHRFYADRR
jgi:hypothetical protein